MDTSPVALIKAFVPKIPLIVWTAVAHTLSLSPTSKDWDLRTELFIKVLRSFLTKPRPETMSKIQDFSMRDPGIKGPMWISKVTLPLPEDTDVRLRVQEMFEKLREDDARLTEPEVVEAPVEGEWTGHRSDAGAHAPELAISEEEKYQRLMGEVESDVTILYFHGGAYW